MKSYDYKETLQQVDGLNSISTLKRWRKLAENLAGAKFSKTKIRTGRRSYAVFYIFTDDDIKKLRLVVELKENLGLEKAIIKAFSQGHDPPLLPEERITILEKELRTANSKLACTNEQLRSLTTEYNQLSVTVQRIVTDLESFEQRSLFVRKKRK